MRWVVLACVLLFTFASTAQAAHLHRLPKISPDQRVQLPLVGTLGVLGEEHCLLCMAMQSTLPAAMAVAPSPGVLDTCSVRLQAEREGVSPWHFPNFSRPPPPLD